MKTLQMGKHLLPSLLEIPLRVLSRAEVLRSIEFTQCLAACVAAASGHRDLARAYLEFGEKEALAFLRDEIGFEPESAG